MSVYTELVRIGIHEESAQELAEAAHRSRTIVTTDILDARLAQQTAHLETRIAQLETSVLRALHFSMIAMTAIFAGFVAAMAWVVSQ